MRLIASLAVGVIMGFTSSGLCAGNKAESTPVDPCPPLRTGEATNGWLLAEGNYTARQIGNAVTVRVQGANPTPNYENKLVKSPKMSSPPELINLRKAPSGMQPQVIISYHGCGSFTSQERVNSVIIHDKSGKHTINVEKRGHVKGGQPHRLALLVDDCFIACRRRNSKTAELFLVFGM